MILSESKKMLYTYISWHLSDILDDERVTTIDTSLVDGFTLYPKFEKNKYLITVLNENITLSSNSNYVYYGDQVIISINPPTKELLTSLKINGKEVISQVSNNIYTFDYNA